METVSATLITDGVHAGAVMCVFPHDGKVAATRRQPGAAA
jgi:hypothetical protein